MLRPAPGLSLGTRGLLGGGCLALGFCCRGCFPLPICLQGLLKLRVLLLPQPTGVILQVANVCSIIVIVHTGQLVDSGLRAPCPSAFMACASTEGFHTGEAATKLRRAETRCAHPGMRVCAVCNKLCAVRFCSG